MKTYRKNRTQCAKLFSVNGISMLGFLVGEQDNKQTFETLKGERVNVSTIKNSEGKIEDIGDEIVEITLAYKRVTNTKTGIITTTPFGNVITKNSVGGKIMRTPKDVLCTNKLIKVN